MATALADMTDEDLATAVREQGSAAAFARESGVAESTVRDLLRRRGLSTGRPSKRRAITAPALTRESLHRALEPPNLCKVKAFLDEIDEGSRAVVEEALGYPKQDFPANALREWLIREGFREQDVPGSDPINDHRSGRRPCRCRG